MVWSAEVEWKRVPRAWSSDRKWMSLSDWLLLLIYHCSVTHWSAFLRWSMSRQETWQQLLWRQLLWQQSRSSCVDSMSVGLCRFVGQCARSTHCRRTNCAISRSSPRRPLHRDTSWRRRRTLKCQVWDWAWVNYVSVCWTVHGWFSWRPTTLTSTVLCPSVITANCRYIYRLFVFVCFLCAAVSLQWTGLGHLVIECVELCISLWSFPVVACRAVE